MSEEQKQEAAKILDAIVKMPEGQARDIALIAQGMAIGGAEEQDRRGGAERWVRRCGCRWWRR